jgi:Raf kinase inhibitor-like YbhB/YbcL family protein
LLCEDPDAPSRNPFVHWLAYKIPGTAREMPEGIPKKTEVKSPVRIVQGRNSFGDIGYDGPMPPAKDKPHHYHFKLFAIDTELPMDTRLDKTKLENAMKGHVLAEAEIIGTYQR